MSCFRFATSRSLLDFPSLSAQCYEATHTSQSGESTTAVAPLFQVPHPLRERGAAGGFALLSTAWRQALMSCSAVRWDGFLGTDAARVQYHPDRSLAPSFVATACLRPLHRVREQGGQSNPPQIGKARPVTLHTGTDDSEPKANPRASLGRSLPRAAPAPGSRAVLKDVFFVGTRSRVPPTRPFETPAASKPRPEAARQTRTERCLDASPSQAVVCLVVEGQGSADPTLELPPPTTSTVALARLEGQQGSSVLLPEAQAHRQHGSRYS